jgi:hypothetical protein
VLLIYSPASGNKVTGIHAAEWSLGHYQRLSRGLEIYFMLKHSDHGKRSMFTPENLLREARRQKAITKRQIPRICVFGWHIVRGQG